MLESRQDPGMGEEGFQARGLAVGHHHYQGKPATMFLFLVYSLGTKPGAGGECNMEKQREAVQM